MLGLGALGQLPLGGGPFGFVTPTDIKWFEPLSEPVRFKRVPRAAVAVNNQTVAFNPQPVVSFGWFGSLSQPTFRQETGLPGYEQQFTALHPNPIVSFGWFEPLSEPKRFLEGLKPHLQKVTNEQDTDYIPRPNTLFGSWYGQLSMPVRVKPRLRTGLQPAWTGPDRLLPTPNVTVTMSAFEINTDQALMAIRVFPYNPPASATVSIVEIGDDGSATSVVEV